MPISRLAEAANYAPMRLRIARTKSAMTQSEISRQLGISRGRWSQYEKGQRLINWKIVGEVSVLCGVDPNYILFGFVTDTDLATALREAKRQVEREDGLRVMDGLHLWVSVPRAVDK